MTWQLAITMSMLANVTATLVQRHYAQKSTVPASIPTAASYLFGVMPVGLVAGYFILPHAITWSWWLVLLLAICGASMAIANVLGFRASRHLPVVANMTIGKVTSITTVLIAWTILGEGLTTPQLVGGIILLGAAMLAIWAPSKTSTGQFKHLEPKIVLLALTSCVALAIGLVSEKAILGHMQVGGVFLVGWSVQTLSMTLLATKDITRKRLQTFRRDELNWSTLMGTVWGLTGTFYVYAIFRSDNISLISSLGAIVLPLTVLGAYLFLGEREHHKLMWASLALSFIGLLVTAS